MSRIGKKAILVPDKVEVKVNGLTVHVQGPKGELTCNLKGDLEIKVENKEVHVSLKNTAETTAMWGTARTLINNMITGVTQGFTRVLEFNGVGYKAAVSGNKLVLNLGYSHPINYELPKGIAAKVNANRIELTGSDKELLGFVASKIRSFREPEPYKGKGIKYLEEVIIRKAGKTGTK